MQKKCSFQNFENGKMCCVCKSYTFFQKNVVFQSVKNVQCFKMFANRNKCFSKCVKMQKSGVFKTF